MNITDRFYIFRKSTGELVVTCDDLDILYQKINVLKMDLTFDYIVYDNNENRYFDVFRGYRRDL